MAAYLLYLPGVQGANPAHLDTFGLADLRADRSPEFADCLHGPDGGCGLFAYWHVKNFGPNLTTSLYAWQQPPGAKYWLGVLEGQAVDPASVQRDVIRSGYWVSAADGQAWQIPAAEKLPHRHGLDADGKFTRMVVEQFRDYFTKSQQYAVLMFEALDQLEMLSEAARKSLPAETLEFSLSDTWDFCCRAISINYRLTPEMISVLGIMDDDTMGNMVKAAIDLPVLIDVKKKDGKPELVGIPVGLNG